MNNTKNIFLISIIFISFLKSDLASPEPFTVQQPSGQRISINNRGNHLQGWREYNGWTITKNSEGWWVYAQGNNGRYLIPSNIKVDIDNIKRLDEINRELIQKKENYEKNKKEISKSKDEKLFKQSKEISDQIDKISEEQRKIKNELEEILSNIPNIPNKDVPNGRSFWQDRNTSS